MEKFRHLSGVSTLTLDSQACVGCGECQTVCPHGVFEVNGRELEIVDRDPSTSSTPSTRSIVNSRKIEIVDRDGCMECGACALNCPTAAVKVTPGVGCAAYIIQTWFKGKPVTGMTAEKCG